jgi:hypothetical protein
MALRHGHRFWKKYRGRPGWYLVFMVAQKNAKRCNRCTPDARVAAADRCESATVPPCSSPLSQSRRLMSDISDAAVSDMSDGNTRAEHEKRTEMNITSFIVYLVVGLLLGTLLPSLALCKPPLPAGGRGGWQSESDKGPLLFPSK